MIQLICNGVEVDVPRGTSIAWKNTNILFAFDKASCERSLTFTLPSTATNDTVFELCRLPQYVGQGFRRLYDAEYRDGLLVKRGYAYVTQSQKSGYNVTLVVGELTALKRLKDAGRVGEVLPDAAVTVPKAAIDAREPEYNGLKVLNTVHTDLTQNIMPSWCFRPLLVDVLNELQVPFTLPSVAEDLRIMVKNMNGAKTSVKFKNVRHSEVTGPTKDANATDKYNTLSVSDDTWIDVVEYQHYAQSWAGFADLTDPTQAPVVDPTTDPVGMFRKKLTLAINANQTFTKWNYFSGHFYARVPLKLTFPSDFPDNVFIKPVASYGGGFAYMGWSIVRYQQTPLPNILHEFVYTPGGDPEETYYDGYHAQPAIPYGYMPYRGMAEGVLLPPNTSFDPNSGLVSDRTPSQYDIPNKSLAGITVEIPAGTRFVFAEYEDFVFATDGSNKLIYDLQPRFNDYEYDIEVEADIVDTPTDWTFSKRQNSPDMTAVDMLKTLANVSGKVLYYTDANGISFEDLLPTDFTPLDLTSKLIAIKSLKPRFADYDKANIVKYKDDGMTTQQDMISIDYESNAAMLQGEKTLQTLPFSCVSNSRVFVGSETGEYFDRARVVDGDNKKPSADVLLTINANDTFTQRVPLVKNTTIQQLCKEPLTIEATLHMSNYEYSQIQPFSLIHLNGVDYVWTESTWQKNTATLTLSKLPLTLSEPQPAPPALYIYYDYLESDNRQYISDIDMYNTLDAEYEIEFDATTAGWLFGSAARPGSPDSCAIYAHASNGAIRFAQAYVTGLNLLGHHVVVFNRYGYTIDGAYHAFSQNVTSVSSAALMMFAATGATARPQASIMGLKRKNSGALVQHFRPAVRIADGVPGMHDVVNDVFYPSSTNVAFLYGNF